MEERDNLVLVAEDDPVLRLIIVKQLSKLGYIGHTAENGAEAVIMSAKIPYSVILMDVQMPKMDGITATRAIRERENGKKRIPILALTSTTDRQTCIEAGMDDFLSKPITLDQLKATLEYWLAHRAAS